MSLKIIFQRLISSQQARGWYDPITGVMHYTDDWSRLHELGHQLDHVLGDISQGKEFRRAVEIYNQVQWQLPADLRDANAWRIGHFPGINAPRDRVSQVYSDAFWQGGWGGYRELYAELWAMAGGEIHNVPVSLRVFFKKGGE